jgi:hypothetical protein
MFSWRRKRITTEEAVSTVELLTREIAPFAEAHRAAREQAARYARPGTTPTQLELEIYFTHECVMRGLSDKTLKDVHDRTLLLKRAVDQLKIPQSIAA